MAVAELPIVLKFSVIVLESVMTTCPKANEPVINTKKAASAKIENLFIIFLDVINSFPKFFYGFLLSKSYCEPVFEKWAIFPRHLGF